MPEQEELKDTTESRVERIGENFKIKLTPGEHMDFAVNGGILKTLTAEGYVEVAVYVRKTMK